MGLEACPPRFPATLTFDQGPDTHDAVWAQKTPNFLSSAIGPQNSSGTVAASDSELDGPLLLPGGS